ncbi:ankyrin repeat domain-containing protein [Candidatus Berkiella aquae]|uniref:Ankyrin repeat domain-containing protein n=1 Tax=Candidatus Berkiella aquae TaxID=295108 RepID=A0A0Q9Z0X9_9GAMM|nr:ankyrin repeat domain-containing protein [Candidatus Berkiella aquae]MCS5711948.1 ankyrin repeat domain-containing protein [Candidatus Berkiella aquae]
MPKKNIIKDKNENKKSDQDETRVQYRAVQREAIFWFAVLFIIVVNTAAWSLNTTLFILTLLSIGFFALGMRKEELNQATVETAISALEKDFLKTIRKNGLNQTKLLEYVSQGLIINRNVGISAVAAAISVASTKQIDLLIAHVKAKRSKNDLNDMLWTGVLNSIEQNQENALKHLLKEVEDVDFGIMHCTPLLTAISMNRPNMVKILLQHGAIVTDLILEVARRNSNKSIYQVVESAHKKNKGAVTPLFKSKQTNRKTPTKPAAKPAAKPAVSARKQSLRSHQK